MLLQNLAHRHDVENDKILQQTEGQVELHQLATQTQTADPLELDGVRPVEPVAHAPRGRQAARVERELLSEEVVDLGDVGVEPREEGRLGLFHRRR